MSIHGRRFCAFCAFYAVHNQRRWGWYGGEDATGAQQGMKRAGGGWNRNDQ